MTLEEFEHAEALGGHVYELSRGVVTVVDVPHRRHLAQLDEIKEQLYVYKRQHRDVIHRIAGGSDCKILLKDVESERHPDLAIYKSQPANEQDWSTWIPELVIEIVSPGSETRDYEQKPEEYLAFGVMEYWIVDAAKEEILVMRRSAGRWANQVLKADAKYKTRLLPDFELDVAPIFAAARSA
jgi:Uma2 family endonuclease